MTSKSGNDGKRKMETTHFVVLSKLAQTGQPMNLLEIGFTATPQAVRNMAARGLVKVTVTMTERGMEYLDKEQIRRLRRAMKAQKEKNAAERQVG